MPPPDEGAPALRLEGVRRSFRSGKRVVAAIDGITASAAHGAVTGLIGPDGAGKTTLMRLIAGLLRADAGRIEALGIDVRRDPLAVQARIGYMPQRFGLYEDLSVRQNLDLYADLQGVPMQDRPARYAELLHMTALGPFTERRAGRLSGGMKQKLGLACTLVHPPELLLLDEPTVGVDPVSRRELWRIIDHLTRDAKVTVLFSTAYLDEAERCDAVLLLHEGRLLGSGPPGAFTAELAGRSFFASADVGKRRLQERLAREPGVIDAVIQGSRVRVVTATPTPPDVAALAAELPGLTFAPTAPRFEDSFVAQLRARGAGTPPAAAPRAPAPIAASAAEDVIEVRRLTRRFGDFVAVNDVSFRVARGEIFGLLGANGAGKSTTFRMLCGLLPPSEGVLRVAGFDLRKAAATARGRIGYMAQKFSLYGDLSVKQNLTFFAGAYGLNGRRRAAAIDRVIDAFDLEPRLDVTTGGLPLGFKQRLALSCAILHEPPVLFLDEPTSGVDPLTRREFWGFINAMVATGVTIMVTTHFMDEAEYCDRVALIYRGQCIAIDAPEALQARVKTPDLPHPTLEDAFIGLIEEHDRLAA